MQFTLEYPECKPLNYLVGPFREMQMKQLIILLEDGSGNSAENVDKIGGGHCDLELYPDFVRK